jgi:hypothetical protein
MPTHENTSEKASTTLPGIVQKIISPPCPEAPEKAQILVESADHLYRELRLENRLTNEDGEQVKLKPGAEVEVTIAADEAQTTQTDRP